jgi:diadenosine tetraphosphate (Ap4A) HIT family hydrolase
LLLEQAKERRSYAYRLATVTGFNVGINDGSDAGQTIMHCHIHLIPRRNGDVVDPRRGIRHVIPSKGSPTAASIAHFLTVLPVILVPKSFEILPNTL